MPEKKSIFICAGDPSGDIAGYHLIKEIQRKFEGVEIAGLGGNRMKSAGQKQIIDGSQLAVLGFGEVAQKFFFFRKLMHDTIDLVKESKPDVIVLIDYPGFNLSLAKRIKHLGIPIIYYISPQIWAWAPGRIKKIKRLVDLMLLILPFEGLIYDQAGISNKFVGHYLLDDMDEKYIKAPYNKHSDLITLMPGSRPQEIERMLPVLLKSAELLFGKYKFRFTVAGIENDFDYAPYMKNSSIAVKIEKGTGRHLIYNSRLVLTSSGTATLETGLIGRPMVVIYKAGFLTYHIARSLIKIKNIALINITSGKTVVPELIQSSASAKNIAEVAGTFLDNDDLTQETISELNKTADKLGEKGGARKAVEAIEEYLSW